MDIITILEANIRNKHQKDWYLFLSIQKVLVEQHFEFLNLCIDQETKSLLGKGLLIIGIKKYNICLSYSPFHKIRYDRIFLNEKTITYHKDIHLYGDMSLCLYHPIIDKPLFQIIPLFQMIPWITEWIVFYEQWKKYGVWLGKEIKH